MAKLAKKFVVDTNVPKTANLAIDPSSIPGDLFECVSACIDAIEDITQNGGLVLDAGDEIFNEYRQQLSMTGQPGLGDRFMKWVHDNRWQLPESDRIPITQQENGYAEFPSHDGLLDFDPSDRKFVAVANAHPRKPTILQATDSKWWGWHQALSEAGITVQFLCPAYLETKYQEKMGS